ncbi:LysR substrate-binding domain-containing protein [Kitasatospora sp. NPDC094011]|uniref:LysR substrate-binding domain-containing protein n=1 Tax=Kitasatospora sp. NPDC094011 TaxID=3364090 RepID=UPI00380BC464
MEYRQLQYFVVVVEEANFTRAAARLRLSQPGISSQIRQLERELGQQLLDRSGRTVTVTDVGRAVLPAARAALAAFDGVRQVVDEVTGLLRGHVRIGLVSGTATHELDVASVLADFHDEHPQIEITLGEDTSERMHAALYSGELDFALVGLTDPEPSPGLSHQIVIDTPLVAVIAPGDPLAAGGEGAEIPMAALRDRPLITLPRGTGLRGVLDRACAAAGFQPRIAFEAATPHLLAQLAVRGLGVAVLPSLPEGTAASLGLRSLGLVAPQPRGRIALTWRSDGPVSVAARALLERLKAELPSPGSTRGSQF